MLLTIEEIINKKHIQLLYADCALNRPPGRNKPASERFNNNQKAEQNRPKDLMM